ncbi:MAG TPA: DegV family protein, partial [Acidimicrobiia bacterium]
ARRAGESVGNVFVVGALELAKRGGRLRGDAAAEAEQGVAVLALLGGAMDVVAHARDVEDAVGAMATVVEEAAAGSRLRVGVGDAVAPELAASLAGRLEGQPNVEELVRYEVGPSVTAHTGLGTAGAVYFPADLTGG